MSCLPKNICFLQKLKMQFHTSDTSKELIRGTVAEYVVSGGKLT